MIALQNAYVEFRKLHKFDTSQLENMSALLRSKNNDIKVATICLQFSFKNTRTKEIVKGWKIERGKANLTRIQPWITERNTNLTLDEPFFTNLMSIDHLV